MFRSMFRSMLGGARTGVLSRLSFLVAVLVLQFGIVLLVRGCQAVQAIRSQPLPADLADNTLILKLVDLLQLVPDQAGVAVVIGLALLAVFAHQNLLAQRIRDMGLPGWRWSVGFATALALAIVTLPVYYWATLFAPVVLALVIMPGATFKHWRRWFGLPDGLIIPAEESVAG